jgi:lysophospholipase L1-like esterase
MADNRGKHDGAPIPARKSLSGLRIRFASILSASLALLLSLACTPDVQEPQIQSSRRDTTAVENGPGIASEEMLASSVIDPGAGTGLARFVAKAKAGGEIRVAFIGGSITAGARAVDAAHRYSSLVCRRLAEEFPQSRFTEINAGIGATGSRFGASRVAYDVLAAAPDLIVVEFAVNDDLSDTLSSRRTFEGLIRHCLSGSASVLIFQTMNRHGDSSNQEIQARIGKHYGLPVISYRAACWPLIAAGRMAWADIAADDVHPNDYGHALCANLIGTFLIGQAERSPAEGLAALPADPEPPAEPLYSDAYQFSDLFHTGDAALRIVSDSGWTETVDDKGRITLSSEGKGDKLVLESTAHEITWAYRYAGDQDAKVEVKAGGVPLDTLSNHFAEDWGGGYLRLRTLATGIPGTDGRIELRNATGGHFEMTYILYCP